MRIAVAYKWLVVALAVGLLTACPQSDDEEEPEAEEVAIPVQLDTVQPGNVVQNYRGNATLESEHESEVVAKLSGVVTQLFAEEGDVVAKGDLLAKIEDDRYRLEHRRANAQLEQLRSEFERAERMVERQLLSEDEFERVRSEYERQRATLSLAALDLEWTNIRSPIDGVVSARLIKLGNLINQYEPMFRVHDLDPLHAIANVAEQHIGQINVGQIVSFQTPTLGRTFEGTVLRVSPVVDAATGTFKVTAAINAESVLKPGMFGAVAIELATREQVPTLPRDALIVEDGNEFVFKVDGDSIARRTAIVTGFSTGDRIEVLDGVSFDDQVVTVGKNAISDGTPVLAIETSQTTANSATFAANN